MIAVIGSILLAWQKSPVINMDTRQGTVRIAVPYSEALRPGGFADARLIAGTAEAPLLPESAVQSGPEGNFVLIVDANNVIKRQPVVPLEAARQRLAALVPDLIDWASIQQMHVIDEESKGAPRRSEVASFFSAALELTKNRVVDIRQDQLFSDVFVRKTPTEDLKAAE